MSYCCNNFIIPGEGSHWFRGKKRLHLPWREVSRMSSRHYLLRDLYFFARLNPPAITQGIIAKKPINANSPLFETSETNTIPRAVTK